MSFKPNAVALAAAAAEESDLATIWSTIKCGFLTQEQQDVIVIDADAKLTQACSTLAQNGISSAPVYDSHKKSFIGMFEYGDLATLVLTAKQKIPITEEHSDLEYYLNQQGSFGMSVRHVVDLSERNPFYSLFPESTLLNAVQVFANGVRRIVVMSGDGKLGGIISQTTVVRFVSQHLLDQFDPVLKLTVDQLNIGSSPVISLNANKSVSDAMLLMDTNKISSVALVEDDGSLWGNMSLSDIKLIFRKKTLSYLNHSCRSYIATLRQEEIKANDSAFASEAKFPYWSVSSSTPLRVIIMKMAATRSHHLFVTDAANHPIRVVSVGDVVRALTPPL